MIYLIKEQDIKELNIFLKQIEKYVDKQSGKQSECKLYFGFDSLILSVRWILPQKCKLLVLFGTKVECNKYAVIDLNTSDLVSAIRALKNSEAFIRFSDDFHGSETIYLKINQLKSSLKLTCNSILDVPGKSISKLQTLKSDIDLALSGHEVKVLPQNIQSIIKHASSNPEILSNIKGLFNIDNSLVSITSESIIKISNQLDLMFNYMPISLFRDLVFFSNNFKTIQSREFKDSLSLIHNRDDFYSVFSFNKEDLLLDTSEFKLILDSYLLAENDLTEKCIIDFIDFEENINCNLLSKSNLIELQFNNNLLNKNLEVIIYSEKLKSTNIVNLSDYNGFDRKVKLSSTDVTHLLNMFSGENFVELKLSNENDLLIFFTSNIKLITRDKISN